MVEPTTNSTDSLAAAAHGSDRMQEERELAVFLGLLAGRGWLRSSRTVGDAWREVAARWSPQLAECSPPAHPRAALSGIEADDLALHFLAQAQSWCAESNLGRNGAIATPAHCAAHMAELAMGQLTASEARAHVVLDPACGSGQLLVAALRQLVLRGADPWHAVEFQIWGMDIRPESAVTCRRALVLAAAGLDGPPATPVGLGTIRQGNALEGGGHLGAVHGPRVPSPNTVLLNPPYANGVEDSSREAGARAHARARFLTAVGAFDWSAVFQEVSLSLLSPGGRLVAIVPDKTLCARWGEPLREFLREAAQLECVEDWREAKPFGSVAVYPIVYVARRNDGAGPPPIRVRRRTRAGWEQQPDVDQRVLQLEDWGILLSGRASQRAQQIRHMRRLGDLAEIRAGLTVGEAYALRAEIREGVATAETPGIVTSGSIGDNGHSFGARAQRYLGTTWQAPVLPRSSLSPGRQAQLDTCRIVIAGLTKKLRIAPLGPAHLGSIGTQQILVLESPVSGVSAAEWLRALSQYLLSAEAQSLFRDLNSASTLAGGALQVTRRSLQYMPVPWDLSETRHERKWTS